MSRWASRLSLPHPTLARGRSDYKDDCFFHSRIASVGRRNGATAAIVDHDIGCGSLEELIARGDAAYCSLASCGESRVREAFISAERRQRLELPLSRYPFQVNLEFFVVARVESRVSAVDLAADLAMAMPDGFSAPAGAPLALGGAGVINPDKALDAHSFVEFINSDAIDRGEFEIDLSGDRISIEVNPKDRADIERLRHSGGLRHSIWASVFVMAIEKGVRLHLSEEYADKRWAINTRRRMADEGIEVDEDALEKKALAYAHRLLDRPFGKMLADRDIAEEE